jgi:hypothetical protein
MRILRKQVERMRSLFIFLFQVRFRTLLKTVTDVLVSKKLRDLFDHMRKGQLFKKHTSPYKIQ